jgi:hypothetical protein
MTKRRRLSSSLINANARGTFVTRRANKFQACAQGALDGRTGPFGRNRFAILRSQCQPVFGARKMLRPKRSSVDNFATLNMCAEDSDGGNLRDARGFSMVFFSPHYLSSLFTASKET